MSWSSCIAGARARVEVHAAGNARHRNGTGYLFLGHSGAGKSHNLPLESATYSMTVLSDDRIILRETDGRSGCMARPAWGGRLAAPERARIDRLFILEHAPSPPSPIESPLSARQSGGRNHGPQLPAFYDAVALENTMSFLQEIVAAIPCYRLEFRLMGRGGGGSPVPA